ncbi:MAG: UDP-N-acetylmuramate--L-alanine ligase [Patescibacteria group bacterium]
MNVRDFKSVHFVGIGGINMSAVAKLLLAAGVRVSGSDVAESEQTKILLERGATIKIGHVAENIPNDTQAIIYTSAAPETNPERIEGKKRGLPEFTNFQFLSSWFSSSKTILVAGTHGKSTTTAMLGLILEKAKLDPTVVVGSKVPSFPDGNLRIGSSDLFIIEGDEYARHFLEFKPFGVVLNNIELDHTDVFPTIEEMKDAFGELIGNIQPGGVLVANVGDWNVASLIASEADALTAHRVRIVRFNGANDGEWQVTHALNGAYTEVSIAQPGIVFRLNLAIPGQMNALNAAGATLMARELGASYPDIAGALESFKGIWRRFEFLCEKNGAKIYSDYGHHPTAVAATLAAAKEQFPNFRLVLCFQPHHRNRTKNLFLDFIPSFDLADVLVLCEIYDVAGRDASEDDNISSKDLLDAVIRHDADRGVKREVEYAPDPKAAVERTSSLMQSGDMVIFMGAGDIDGAARNVCLN